ncbi:hypothetical protein [Nocardia sp. NPDC051463]|uniref:hypothetical protein n=1 Tax=Nocardia sp. NPDC051463 TaxID=3154845 RepID=UPI0034505596
MSETREVLAQLITEAVAIAAETSAGINPEFDGQIVIDWQHGLPDLVAALDSLALVVPRSEIVGTEYGWRRGPSANVRLARSRASAIEQAADSRSAGGVWAASEAVEHVIAWSVIPLPEEGEQ